MLIRFLLALGVLLGLNGLLLAETSKQPQGTSPVKDIIEGSCQRTLDRNLSAVQVLSGYSANVFSTWADPDNGSSSELIVEDGLQMTLSLVVKKMKKEVVQSQVTYNGAYLQGLTAFQWYLISREIPSRNTFTFHRTLQNLEDLFKAPAVATVLGDINHALLFLDKEGICKSWLSLQGWFDTRKLAQGVRQEQRIKMKNAVAEAISYSSEIGHKYLNGSGTSFNRMAVFFAVLADTLWHAREAKGDEAAFSQLLAVLCDLRLVTWRVGQSVSLDGKYDIESRIEDFLEKAVREVLIYNTRLFHKGFIVRGPVNPSDENIKDGMTLLRKLEIVQSRLLQIQSIQRRALRALSEIVRIEEKHPVLKTVPLWMYGELRAHLGELLRELQACIYGDDTEYVSPGSVEGMLFSPVMKGEILSVVTLIPDSTATGGGVASARDEVVRLLHKIKTDHDSLIVPFLTKRSAQLTELVQLYAHGMAPVLSLSPSTVKERLEKVQDMVVSGRAVDGSLLSPEQMDYLRVEDYYLWNEYGIGLAVSKEVTPPSTSVTPAGN